MMPGRVLAPTLAPVFVSMRMTARHPALARVWSSWPRVVAPIPALPCRVTGDGADRRLTLWISGADGPYEGEPAQQVIVTALGPDPADLRSGRRVESVDLAGGAGGRRWEEIGVLDRPIGTPHWLARFLREATWPHSPITPSARHPWPIPVQRCLVAGGGLALWLEGGMGWGEVLAGVRRIEDQDYVGVLVHLGISADLRAGPRGGARGRPAVRRRWRVEVPLSAPLGTRPVVDLAPEDGGSGAARSWRLWRIARG